MRVNMREIPDLATSQGVRSELLRVLQQLLPGTPVRAVIDIDVREPFSSVRGRRFVVQMRMLVWKDWIAKSVGLIDGALQERMNAYGARVDLQFLPWVFRGNDKIPAGVIQVESGHMEELRGASALRFMPTMPPSLDVDGNEFPETIRTDIQALY